MGGGSITLRSRSPNPQARAATGCCRTTSLYSYCVLSCCGPRYGALGTMFGPTLAAVAGGGGGGGLWAVMGAAGSG